MGLLLGLVTACFSPSFLLSKQQSCPVVQPLAFSHASQLGGFA